MKAYLALDVGGTEIKSFLFQQDGTLLSGPRFYPSHSRESADTLVKHFCCVLHEGFALAEALHLTISGIGMAFPGPFDYENGVSLMQGIGKFDALYGLSLPSLLKEDFPGIPLAFANDADLFGLGEYHFSGIPHSKRVFYLCIGTGIGSCFIENGALVKRREDVPENGWIFRTPCEGSTADARLSVTGLLELAAQNPKLAAYHSGKDLAEAAFNRLPEAQAVFTQFGRRFARTVLPFAEQFQAEQLVIGGQIAKSFSLFGETLTAACETRGVKVTLCADSALYAAKGTICLFQLQTIV